MAPSEQSRCRIPKEAGDGSSIGAPLWGVGGDWEAIYYIILYYMIFLGSSLNQGPFTAIRFLLIRATCLAEDPGKLWTPRNRELTQGRRDKPQALILATSALPFSETRLFGTVRAWSHLTLERQKCMSTGAWRLQLTRTSCLWLA